MAHFWDFGGQEVYHATHRLFLGRRSLYLLVWATESPDAAHEERHPPQYWLDMIADIGGNERSRVLIVQNLFDGQTERNILTDAERQDYEKRGFGHHNVLHQCQNGCKNQVFEIRYRRRSRAIAQNKCRRTADIVGEYPQSRCR